MPAVDCQRFRRVWLLLALLLVSCGGEPPTWDRIEAAGVLRVGLDPTFPPFEVLDDNGLYGLDVDLAEALAAELGLTASYNYFGYDGLYDALGTEQVDVLISALVIQPERTAAVSYSDPYFNAGQVLVVPAGTTDVDTLADMDGRTLAVELGAEGHVIASQWTRRLADLTVTTYQTPADALTAVAEGAADAVLVDSVSARQFLHVDDRLALRGAPVTVVPYALVVRVEDEELLRRLNEALARLEASGALDDILARWLGE